MIRVVVVAVTLGVLAPSAVARGRQATAAVPDRAAIDVDALMRTVTTLASPEMEGRRTGSEGNRKARVWIADRFQALGLEPLGTGFLLSFTFTRNNASSEGVNVAARCRGSRQPADAIVITAHYDHLGVRDGRVYPGADDNASGTAVLLALAERCRKQAFAHDAIFVALDAEEIGLQGAKAFVAKPPIPRERIALNVNLDMVSRSDRRELYAAGTHQWPHTRAVLETVAARAPVTLLFGHDKPKSAGGGDDWTLQSDHGAFHQAGIPFVYFGVEDHPDYHRPSDTPDTINRDFFRDVAVTILDAVLALDAAMPSRR